VKGTLDVCIRGIVLTVRRVTTPQESVLCYDPRKRSQRTVRRHYEAWREAHGIPLRCDNDHCAFHKSQLVWNGRPLPLILDHVNSNRFDNRIANLRFLCANCDSQLSTRGGRNRGRVADLSSGGFALARPDGTRDFTMPIDEAGQVTISGSSGVELDVQTSNNALEQTREG
jgi:hypothetical protein